MQTRVRRLGHFHETSIPPVEADTTYFNGAGLRIGVELREVTQADAAQFPDAEMTDDDRGISFHVFSSSDGAEYLRFDCFEVYPHYHYMTPAEGQVHFVFDRDANGNMVDWTLDKLRNQFATMMQAAEGPDCHGIEQSSEYRELIDRVEAFAIKSSLTA